MSENDDDPSATSVTESDPVSDVDPEEMARLLAEIGNIDDDTVPKKSQDSKVIATPTKDLTLKKSSPENIKLSTKIQSDDWDEEADDILKSDSDRATPKAKKEKVNDRTKSPDQTNQVHNEDNEIFQNTNVNNAAQDEDKYKVLKSNNIKESFDSPNKEQRKLSSLAMKKTKEVSFDEDDDPLDMENKTSKPKAGRKAVESGFMDSLLGKTSQSQYEDKKPSKDFSLPDRYKSTSENLKSGDELSSYEPSRATSGSFPKRNPGRAAISDSLEELFTGDSTRTRRRGTPTKENKSFKINDDEILSSFKGKCGKEMNSNAKSSSSSALDLENNNSKQENWLFSGTKRQTPEKKKEPTSPLKDLTLHESGDWLNQLLTSDKTSHMKQSKQIDHQNLNPKNPSTSAEQKNSQESHAAIPSNTGPSRESEKVMNPSHISSLTAMAQTQQQYAENQIQILQLQLQEQQSRMNQMVSQQNQLAMASMPVPNSYQSFTVEDEESIKNIKIDLHKAKTEVGSLQAELELLKKQHSLEVEILTAANRKRMVLEKEMWNRTEDMMKEDREKLVESHNCKLQELQQDKEALIDTYESNLLATKAEWAENLARTKELYSSVIDRMKREHQNAVERLTELKNVELQALISATGKAKEAEMVFDQLEENTANLSKLALCVQERNDSAFQMSKKTLEMKEKQLKEMESHLSVSHAETESERNRLTVLVNRLESNLANQGTEVETEKWKLAREKTKLEMGITALAEERRQFSVMMEKEQLELTKAKQILWNEQREAIQTIIKQKSEISSALSRVYNKSTTNYESEFNLSRLNEEKTLLEEKIIALKLKKEELIDEEYRIEEKNVRLREEQDKITVNKESFAREKDQIEEKRRELERTENKLEEMRNENEKKVNDIIRATDNLHHQEDKIAKEKAKLKQQEHEAMHFINRGMCPSCKSNSALTSSNRTYIRMPGDGIETIKIRGLESHGKNRNFDPASVMERLQAARLQECVQRDEQLQRISAFSSQS